MIVVPLLLGNNALFFATRRQLRGGTIAAYVNVVFETRAETAQLECLESLLVHIGKVGWDMCTLLAAYCSQSGSFNLGDLNDCLSSLPANCFFACKLRV